MNCRWVSLLPIWPVARFRRCPLSLTAEFRQTAQTILQLIRISQKPPRAEITSLAAMQQFPPASAHPRTAHHRDKPHDAAMPVLNPITRQPPIHRIPAPPERPDTNPFPQRLPHPTKGHAVAASSDIVRSSATPLPYNCQDQLRVFQQRGISTGRWFQSTPPFGCSPRPKPQYKPCIGQIPG